MDRELYRNKNSRDNLIEIAIVNYHAGNDFEIILLEFENGFRKKVLKLDDSIVGGRNRLHEITSPTKWERINDSEYEFENLEKCFSCDESEKCLECKVWFTKFNPSKIVGQK